MNYLRAGVNWGHVAVRAAGYGTLSVTAGLANHRASQWAMRQWCRGSCNGLKIRRSIRNAELLGETPQCVFIANHLSLLDILVIGAYLEHDYRWLAKDAVFRVPFLGWHLKLAGHIPVYRGPRKEKNADIATRIHAVVEDGASLLFFPEGTRSETGQLKPFMIGAFMTAVTENLPIVPLVLRGTGELMEKGAKDLAIRSDRECSVTVLPPIPVPERGDDKLRAQRLRASAYEAFARELYPDQDVQPGDEAAEERNLKIAPGV